MGRKDRPWWRKWYKLATWQIARRAQLSKQPLCKFCFEHGRTVAATVVDHIIPHKGNWDLFIDPNNHQSLCKPCHDRDKQGEEARGYRKDVDATTGWPTDERHPANRSPRINGRKLK